MKRNIARKGFIWQKDGENTDTDYIAKRISEKRNLQLQRMGNPAMDICTAQKLAAAYKEKKDSRYKGLQVKWQL